MRGQGARRAWSEWASTAKSSSPTTAAPTARKSVARDHGARVVNVARKGYGSALQGGIAAARGKYIIMGDADDSYDFTRLEPFVDRLRQGDELVMGNRFKGGIKPGAMPWMHRYVGNPVLTGILNLFFHTPDQGRALRLARFPQGRLRAAQPDDAGHGVRQRNGRARPACKPENQRSADDAVARWPRPAAASAQLPRRLAAPAFFACSCAPFGCISFLPRCFWAAAWHSWRGLHRGPGKSAASSSIFTRCSWARCGVLLGYQTLWLWAFAKIHGWTSGLLPANTFSLNLFKNINLEGGLAFGAVLLLGGLGLNIMVI